MALPHSTQRALADAGIAVELDASLVKRTWWRAGGPADGLVDVTTLETLRAVLRIAHGTGCPVFPLGNASNLLISDLGIRGLVLRLKGDLAKAQVAPRGVKLGGGLKLVLLLSRALKNGWTGLEFFAGIPGTVGGAVRMNAGTTLGEVVDGLVEVEIATIDGGVATLPVDALRMAYRTCHLPEGAVVATATFRLTDADPAQSRAAVQHHLERRRQTQPIDQPSCGSTFRNPEGEHAGRLIEAAGLKGFTIGGAMVSPKHANFMVNTGSASATDIRRLIEHVQNEVRQRFAVELVREVHYAGDWSGWT